MAIAHKVLTHLEDSGVRYERITHPHTASSQRTAEAAHVSGDRLAKAVLLEADGGGRVLAVLPASRVIHYPEVNAHYGDVMKPVAEDALQEAFPDCEPGALPPFGSTYGIDTAVDAALLEEDMVYFEAGDHRSVLAVRGADFRRLLEDADFFPFSEFPA